MSGDEQQIRELRKEVPRLTPNTDCDSVRGIAGEALQRV